jgi:FkbM family methyltransferase
MASLIDLFWAFIIPGTSRIDGFRVVTDTRIPLKIRKKLFSGGYEGPERAAVKRFINSKDRVLEIGCGLGVVALTCERASPGHCLHYEPNPDVQEIIRENFMLNGFQCNLVQKAITAHGQRVTFHIADNIWSSSIIDRSLERTVEVDSEAIEHVISAFAPTVVVMDVEGAELEIIEASQFIGVRVLIFETHLMLIGALGIGKIQRHLRSLGFTEQAQEGGKTMKSVVYARESTA